MRLYDADEHLAASLASGAPHPRLDVEVGLPASAGVRPTLAEAVAGSDLVVLAVPGRAVPAAAVDLAVTLPDHVPLVNVAKALERQTGRRLGEVIAAARGEEALYAMLAGGMIASELIGGRRLGANLAAGEIGLARQLVTLFEGASLRVEPSDDVVGVEYAAALKSVVVLGAGLLEGLGFPLGSRSLFISLATAEVEALVVANGGQSDSLAMTSQCWGNDLILSAFGETRNRAFGTRLAEKLSDDDDTRERAARAEEARAEVEARRGAVEGFFTALAVPALAERAGVPMPRLSALARLVVGGIGPTETAEILLA